MNKILLTALFTCLVLLFPVIVNAASVDIILDNGDAGVSSTGNWIGNPNLGQLYGTTAFLVPAGGGVDSYRFTPMFTVAGSYEVFVWNACDNYGSTVVPHRIVSADSVNTVIVNQDCDGGGSFGQWYSLGIYNFAAGTQGYLEISDQGLSSGTHVGADAARFVLRSANAAPSSAFSYTANDLTVTFTDASSDADGSIASRSWSFGDGNISSAINPSHSYAGAGTYTVTLTVTDDDGATDASSQIITVTDPNQ